MRKIRKVREMREMGRSIVSLRAIDGVINA
jgi:hypothetical protein